MALPQLGIRQNNFDQSNLAPALPELVQVQASTLNKIAELCRLALDTVDDRHDAKVPRVGVAGEVAIVGRQGRWSRWELVAALCGVHDLVALGIWSAVAIISRVGGIREKWRLGLAENRQENREGEKAGREEEKGRGSSLTRSRFYYEIPWRP